MKDMIIIKLMGGLGNQMFQYSLGRVLSERLLLQVKYDTSWFLNIPEGDTKRQYELSHFQLKVQEATSQEICLVTGYQKFLPRKIIKLFHSSAFSQYFQEQSFNYNANIWKIGHNKYLEGYWQSFRYFESFESLIKKDFTFHPFSDDRNLIIAKHIMNSLAVSVHIRRGDYIVNSKTKSFHGNLPMEYYYTAIRQMVQDLKNPHFFIFSDDITWVKKNFHIPYEVTYVDCNSNDKAFNDMHLMSLCKHYIIANSTFSWWGAWLGNFEDKKIIAPRQWFKEATLDTKDLIPFNWTQL